MSKSILLAVLAIAISTTPLKADLVYQVLTTNDVDKNGNYIVEDDGTIRGASLSTGFSVESRWLVVSSHATHDKRFVGLFRWKKNQDGDSNYEFLGAIDNSLKRVYRGIGARFVDGETNYIDEGRPDYDIWFFKKGRINGDTFKLPKKVDVTKVSKISHAGIRTPKEGLAESGPPVFAKLNDPRLIADSNDFAYSLGKDEIALEIGSSGSALSSENNQLHGVHWGVEVGGRRGAGNPINLKHFVLPEPNTTFVAALVPVFSVLKRKRACIQK